jgi:hypothetical protein
VNVHYCKINFFVLFAYRNTEYTYHNLNHQCFYAGLGKIVCSRNLYALLVPLLLLQAPRFY